jgi:hypothetical protein
MMKTLFASVFVIMAALNLIAGGYDCAFASNTGYSTISGSLTVNAGGVTIKRTVIR